MAYQSDYNPKYCAEVYKIMAGGCSETKAMAILDVSRSTFYRWKKEHPEFAEACDKGRVQFDAHIEDIGVHGMMKTKDIDFQFYKELAKYRNGWTDKTNQAAITNNTQINIDQLNVLNDMSNEEVLIYIKSQMEKHPELAHIIEGEIVSE